MRITIDSSVIIEVGKRNQEAIELVKDLIKNNEELLISAVSASEVLACPWFSRDHKGAFDEIRQVISQFSLISLDAEVAEKTARYLAYLIAEDLPAQYQDVAIAATFAVTKSDFLITQNKKRFEAIPEIGSKARTISEFRKIYK